MGVDYTAVALVGVPVDQDLVDALIEELVAVEAQTYMDKGWYDNIDAARNDAFHEVKDDWRYEDLRILEAGARPYGGDPIWYVGIPLYSGDLKTVEARAASQLKVSGVGGQSRLILDIRVH